MSNTDTKSVYYKPGDGVYGIKNEIKPGWYIDGEVDGIATSKYSNMVFKLPNGSVAKVISGGGVKVVNAPFYGWQKLNFINSPIPMGWKSNSYFQTLDKLLNGSRVADWNTLFNLAQKIR